MAGKDSQRTQVRLFTNMCSLTCSVTNLYLRPALVVVLLVLLWVVRVLDELLLRVDVEVDSVRVPRPVRVDVWDCVVCVVEPRRPEVTVPLLPELLFLLLICGEFLLPLTSR